MILPITILWVDGSYVEFYPLLIDAESRDEAKEKGVKIADKIRPLRFNTQYVKVGHPGAVTIDNVEFTPDSPGGP